MLDVADCACRLASLRARCVRLVGYGGAPCLCVLRCGRRARGSKIDSGLHPVFHTKNLKASAPDPSYEGKFFNIPDSEIADQEYEIQKIMAHRKRYGRNEFLVHYKGFSELRGEFTEEAELRRNASDLLDEYMQRHQIVTDGYAYDDSDYESSTDDEKATDSSPPVTRKRSASISDDVQPSLKKSRSARGRRRVEARDVDLVDELSVRNSKIKVTEWTAETAFHSVVDPFVKFFIDDLVHVSR